MEDFHSTTKWFTHTRKFPIYIAQFPDGTKIPGGPYSVMELLAAGAVAFVMKHTMWLWAANLSKIMAFAIVLCAAATVMFIVHKAPGGARNPLQAFRGAVKVLVAPRYGTYLGARIQIPGESKTTGRTRIVQPRHAFAGDDVDKTAPTIPVLVMPATACTAALGLAPTTSAAPAPVPAPARPAIPQTNLQRLLASRGA